MKIADDDDIKLRMNDLIKKMDVSVNDTRERVIK